MREEISYLSADGITEIHAVRWIPEGKIRAILQIAHGMAEYILRYEEAALLWNRQGILVTGNDHLGHGKSVSDPSKLGYFAEKDGNRTVLADMRRLFELNRKKYPELPVFLLGHSMGSFLCRQYIAEQGEELAGAIVMGTGMQPSWKTLFGKKLCEALAVFHGWEYRSPFVDQMAFGSYNAGFGEKGGVDWLNTRKECVEAYKKDPLCGFMFTLNAYFNMFDSIHRLSDAGYVGKTPLSLPVLVISGREDPVGEYGKSPREVAEEYRNLGLTDVQLILYPGDRHEILMEMNGDEVKREIGSWMEERLQHSGSGV